MNRVTGTCFPARQHYIIKYIQIHRSLVDCAMRIRIPLNIAGYEGFVLQCSFEITITDLALWDY